MYITDLDLMEMLFNGQKRSLNDRCASSSMTEGGMKMLIFFSSAERSNSNEATKDEFFGESSLW